jgi:hypothetical protein
MDVATVVPAGGLATVIVVLVGYLFKQVVADRADYRISLAAEQARTKAAEQRTTAAIRREEAAQQQVDAERHQRRDAETAAATAVAQLVAAQAIAAMYARELERLKDQHPSD